MANWKCLLRAAICAVFATIHSPAQQLTRITDSFSSSTPEGGAWSPRVAFNARAVAFASGGRIAAADGVIGRRNVNVYYKDLASLAKLVSSTPQGLPGNGDSYAPEISASGRFLLFESTASDLVTNDYNGGIDLFRRDIVTGQTILISVRPQMGTFGVISGNGNSTHGLLSADGSKVVFNSTATDLTVLYRFQFRDGRFLARYRVRHHHPPQRWPEPTYRHKFRQPWFAPRRHERRRKLRFVLQLRHQSVGHKFHHHKPIH
jgi:hypothetical protein